LKIEYGERVIGIKKTLPQKDRNGF